MKNKFVFSIGDERRVGFWDDRRCDDEALCLFFSLFFVCFGNF